MRVNEQLMGVGSWSMSLRPDTPREVLERLWDEIAIYSASDNQHAPNVRSQIVVFDTPTQVPDFAAARHSGILFRRDGAFDFSGVGLGGYTQTDDGIGVLPAASHATVTETVSGGALDSWMAAVISDSLGRYSSGAESNGIFEGDVSNTGLSAGPTETTKVGTVREELDRFCEGTGGEWRMNPDGTIDAAQRSTLFATTPNVLVTDEPLPEGGASPRVVNGSLTGFAVDASTALSRVSLVTKGQGDVVVVSEAQVASRIGRGINGSDLVREKWVDAPSAAASAGNARSQAVRDAMKWAASSYSLNVTSDRLRADVQPGDAIYVWSPGLGVDGGNLVTAAGHDMTPQVPRCVAMDWNVTDGHGVYLHTHDGTDHLWLDLTPYVVWAKPGARLTLETREIAPKLRALLINGGLRFGQDVAPWLFPNPLPPRTSTVSGTRHIVPTVTTDPIIDSIFPGGGWWS